MDTVTIPQLRVRTEFSFGQTFAPIARMADALKEMGCGAAGIVDGDTWGHVRWARALAAKGIKPLFGTEISIPQPDGRAPSAWFLARDSRAFYRLSTQLRREGVDREATLKNAAEGVIRFAGAALSDPETFDYIDVNPSSRLLQRFSLALHRSTGKPLVLTSDNAYATREDYKAFMAISGRERETPQHLLGMDELRQQFASLSDRDFDLAVRNTFDVATAATDRLATAPLISVDGNLTERVLRGKENRLALGHIAEWTPEYETRMRHELEIIAQKKYESYFLVVSDLVNWAKERMLVGPGRGSSAGSLVCYLLRITEVNPLDHDLLFERFIDLNRADLPDIDIDFSDVHREKCFAYLAEKYGAENVARIGSVNTLRARSVIARVVEKLAIPEGEKFDVLNVLVEYSSGDARYGHSLEDTMTQTDPGRRFSAKYPEAAVMYRLENHASHTGVHAAGVIVCNEPVSDFCTVGADGVAHIDKPDAEALGLLKIDALGLRTLGVIEDSGVVRAEELYALKLNDPEVFRIFNEQRYAGVFQFEGHAQRQVAGQVNIDSFRKIDHVTALARPGPLGGGASQRYVERAAGREEITYRHPSMSEYLAKTMGVVLYQEQVMRICFEIGKFGWKTVSEIRKAMSASKGKEYFDRRGEEFIAGAATLGVPRADAEKIWDEICTFGGWGMNASHTVSYGVISYWCAWMKRYHPLEYAAACLRNAKDEAQCYEILREMDAAGIRYISFDIDRSDVDWKVVDGELIGGFMNVVGYGPAKAVAATEARRLGKLDREKIGKAQIKFQQLYPLQQQYGDLYADPESHGCSPGSRVLKVNEMPEDGGVLMLLKVIRKELRDENEVRRIQKRNGKKMTGQTLFLDIIATDDTGIPLRLRVDRFKFESIGRVAAEKLQPEDVLLIRGRRIPNFSMVKVDKMKCVNRPEALYA